MNIGSFRLFKNILYYFRCPQTFGLKNGDHLEGLMIGGITLKWVLMEQELTEFIWHDSEQCQDHASMATNLHVPINTVSFLTSPTTVSFSRGALLHGVGWSFISVSQYDTAIRHANYAREELTARKPRKYFNNMSTIFIVPPCIL